MDLAIQATNFSTASLAPTQARQTVAVAQSPAVINTQPQTRNATQDTNLSQAKQQTQTRPQGAVNQASSIVSRTKTDFEYEPETRHSVMKVTDKQVLIYQVPAKGALEIIKAEEQQSHIQATA